MNMSCILWLKRDLRTEDNAALATAATHGPVLPVYIWEPGLWRQPDASGRQFDFLTEAVADMRGQLAKLGLQLCERVGEAVAVLEDLRVQTGATRLVSHEETGNAWTYSRDRAVAAWARAQSVAWDECTQSAVVRGLKDRDLWARQRNRHVALSCVPKPAQIKGIKSASDIVPRLIADDPCPGRQDGGRQAGLDHLRSFLNSRGRSYRSDMSSPLTAETACSRLSPYLAYGCLSVREVAQIAARRPKEHGWTASMTSFQSRLAWRDHFIQKLEDEPRLEFHSLHPAYEGIRDDDPIRLAAWETGQTGVPFVDACMRYLAATGWINFRMRAMLMAFGSYHLWLDWRLTGLHLARQFTDYEPGIHWPQVQMQSGTTGINAIRVYNPVKQGQDQDPAGVFTRRWVPELATVPDRLLQTPWLWDGAEALHYPAPIVDVAAAAKTAKDRIFALRKEPKHAGAAGRIVKKHASRKDPQRHFVNDRDRRKTKTDPRQGAFDF